MREYKKGVIIILLQPLILLCLSITPGLSQQDDIGDDFDESLDILSRATEKLTLDLLNLKDFQCVETIAIDQLEKKKNTVLHQTYTSQYEVTRKLKQRTGEQVGFTESRTPKTDGGSPPEAGVWPMIETPFTGGFITTFTFQERMSNDYKKLPDETLGPQKCLVFGFETVKEISTSTIQLQATLMSLRQKGIIWIDEKTEEFVRLSGKLKKLPKGIQSYEYQIEFKPQRLYGRTFVLPAQVEIHAESNGKKIQISQHYTKFREKP